MFEAKVSPTLLAQAQRVYLANQRKARARTKTRGEVEGSTRKIYRQKGTGGARHGSIRAPIFVGGGISHGPTGGQNYILKMPRKMGSTALLGALADRAASKRIVVVTGLKLPEKTKAASSMWKKAKLEKGALLVISDKEMAGRKSFRNLKDVEVALASSLNPYEVLGCKQLVISQAAIEALSKRYVN